nr:MAG TPA: hypothetical protein [Bacteriophage sp.]
MDDNYIILIKIALNRHVIEGYSTTIYAIHSDSINKLHLPGKKEKRQKPSFCDFLPFSAILNFPARCRCR